MKHLLHGIFCLLLLSHVVHADERIHSFHSDILVFEDGSMRVTEIIKVEAEHKDIKRGIYRDFPTRYKDRLGNQYKVGFDIQAVERDGRKEDYHTEPMSNGVRVYFGHKDRLLMPGEYSYRFIYQTSRQLGFFETHDELYWNVTGNAWKFPIDSASATVHLPAGVAYEQLTAEAYTGKAGSKEQRFSISRTNNDAIRIEATRPLGRYEGLTIVVGWPRGIVAEPDTTDRVYYILQDNRHLLVACIGLLVLFGYYLAVWMKFGKDPEKGVVVAAYEPPEGYSPAAIRYIARMGYDKTCFAAAIINLAVKGYLSISESDNEYTLEKTGKAVSMAAGEKALADKLLGWRKSITLEQSNHADISAAIDAHEASLQRDYEKEYFLTNRKYFYAGLALTIVVLVAMLIARPIQAKNEEGMFMMVWITIWSTGVIFLVTNAVQSWRRVHGVASFFGAIYLTLFAIPFLAAEIMAIVMLTKATSISVVIILLAALIVNWVFYELLKAPTRAGRTLLDKVEGFKRYIDIAEKHELDYKHPKGRCPELFEKYLPFALAMGIEQKWGEQFADVLEKANVSAQTSYHPGWYSGSHWSSNNIGNFSSSLGSSFTSAIASSSTAPGSSSGGSFSGGGGGGSSGGGGGGGGGGGW